MKRLLLSAGAVLIVGACGLTSPASAQEMIPRAQASGGYQVLAFRGSSPQTLAKGWYGEVVGNLTRHLGAVFEIGGDYKTIDAPGMGPSPQSRANLSAYEYMAGARVSARPDPLVTPFAQFLVGGMRTSGAAVTGVGPLFLSGNGKARTDLALQAGGGLNLFVTDQVGVRVGGDYFRVFENTQNVNALRLAIGLVIGF